jgi:hypothetical protein
MKPDDRFLLHQGDIQAAGFRWSGSMRCWLLPFRTVDGHDSFICWHPRGSRASIGVGGAFFRMRSRGDLRRVFELLDLALNTLAGATA